MRKLLILLLLLFPLTSCMKEEADELDTCVRNDECMNVIDVDIDPESFNLIEYISENDPIDLSKLSIQYYGGKYEKIFFINYTLENDFTLDNYMEYRHVYDDLLDLIQDYYHDIMEARADLDPYIDPIQISLDVIMNDVTIKYANTNEHVEFQFTSEENTVIDFFQLYEDEFTYILDREHRNVFMMIYFLKHNPVSEDDYGARVMLNHSYQNPESTFKLDFRIDPWETGFIPSENELTNYLETTYTDFNPTVTYE